MRRVSALESARRRPGPRALERADVIVLAPSNPYVSIGRSWRWARSGQRSSSAGLPRLHQSADRRRAVKGPADRILKGSRAAPVRPHRRLLRRVDHALVSKKPTAPRRRVCRAAIVTRTLMTDRLARRRLAEGHSRLLPRCAVIRPLLSSWRRDGPAGQAGEPYGGIASVPGPCCFRVRPSLIGAALDGPPGSRRSLYDGIASDPRRRAGRSRSSAAPVGSPWRSGRACCERVRRLLVARFARAQQRPQCWGRGARTTRSSARPDLVVLAVLGRGGRDRRELAPSIGTRLFCASRATFVSRPKACFPPQRRLVGGTWPRSSPACRLRFQTLPAAHLESPEPPDEDALVCGEILLRRSSSSTSRRSSSGASARRRPLANSRALEA